MNASSEEGRDQIILEMKPQLTFLYYKPISVFRVKLFIAAHTLSIEEDWLCQVMSVSAAYPEGSY